MSDTLIVLHTAIAIIAIVLLIVVVRVDQVISLIIGTLAAAYNHKRESHKGECALQYTVRRP
jgi:H+/gluconate symporter-like permease